ncbi:FeoA family protein [Nostoc flagelliforme]|uniref:FeoA family protein n=1 Tax=Nostoc flagelliforme TaxID=1306274 RepID=UPI0030D1482A
MVTFCKIQDERILSKLMSMGISPGATITLKQNLSALTIKIGNTSVELNVKTTQAIYVRIINNLLPNYQFIIDKYRASNNYNDEL